MFCKNEVPAYKSDDLVMFLMCSEVPSEAQFSCIHNKLLAWKRNDLAMMLISLWSLDISLDQALDTLLGAPGLTTRSKDATSSKDFTT